MYWVLFLLYRAVKNIKMTELIDFVIKITYENELNAIDVEYSIDTKFNDILDEIYEHVGVKEFEKEEMVVMIGMYIISYKKAK